jgi:rhodanese-related sulfurtransferase
MTVEDLLARARGNLERIDPAQAPEAIAAGAVLVDIRSDSQRSRDGVVPDAVFIPRNVLEWRCDPSSPWREPEASDPRRPVIVMCDEGYQSSLAAATLQELGHARATDLVGGFQAWCAAGLPVRAADE